MDNIQIELFGGLSIRIRAGAEIKLSRKNKVLLAVLALSGDEGVSRGKLADLLWGSRDEEHARASLRQALALIRKTLGEQAGCLITHGERVALAGSAIDLDVARFEALARSPEPGDLARAVAIYRGDLLEGFALREDGLEAFLRPTRESLRSRAIQALGRMLDCEPDAAVRASLAARLLTLDPLNEAWHRSLMQAYCAQGRDNAALKQFADCRDLLDRELGIAPCRETVRLFREIRNRRAAGGGRAEAAVAGRSFNGAAQASGGRGVTSGKPAVAVLPFENLCEERGQGHLAAGITHDVATLLLRHRWIAVICYSSLSQANRFANVTHSEPGEASLDYLVTGSVRKAGNQIRVTAQLAAADTGQHLWSDIYDREITDILTLQEEIATAIAVGIEHEVGASERLRAMRLGTADVDAWGCYHLGIGKFYKFTATGNEEALRLFRRSIEQDPDFGDGHAWWAYAMLLAMTCFDVEPTSARLREAGRAARRAVEADPRNGFFHMLLGRILLAERSYRAGLASMTTALELNPYTAAAYAGMGEALACAGRHAEAARHFDLAIRLSPHDPARWIYLASASLARLAAGDFPEAAHLAEQALSCPRSMFWAEAHRASALALAGAHDAASAVGTELRVRKPSFSRAFAERRLSLSLRPDHLQRYLEGLTLAGVPAGEAQSATGSADAASAG